jgi:hypothetical protein
MKVVFVLCLLFAAAGCRTHTVASDPQYPYPTNVLVDPVTQEAIYER